jgi:hypothetical protein
MAITLNFSEGYLSSEFNGEGGTIGSQLCVWLDETAAGSRKPSESDMVDEVSAFVNRPVCTHCWTMLPLSGVCGYCD